MGEIQRFASSDTEPAVPLGSDQLAVFDEVSLNRPVNRCLFITGKAGTGKSTLLRHLAANLNLPAAVVAPTGIAAINVNGQTIHSFFRFRPGPLQNTEDDVTLFRKGTPKRRLLEKLEVLIVDEVSMVRADLMDAMDYSLRMNTGVDEPFGGKLLALFGDLWQLEPVVTRGPESAMLESRYRSPFFFDAEVFAQSSVSTVELQTVYRQQTDPEFLDALNLIRRGDPSLLPLINSRVGQEVTGPNLITLTATNARAAAINQTQLAALPGTPQQYAGASSGEFGAEYPTDPLLMLKPGAQIMFVRNGRLWVNGTLGTVVRATRDDLRVALESGEQVDVEPVTWEKMTYDWDSARHSIGRKVVGTFTQVPLKLAWAVTVHKSQGLTFDRVAIDLDRHAFAHGQLYVALSRCRTLEGISLRVGVVPRDLIVHPRIREFEWEQGLDG